MTTIHTKAGTVFINPGTEPVENSSVQLALSNAIRLAEDTGGTLLTPPEEPVEDEGRFTFTIRNHRDEDVEIEMPGLALDQVRYMGEPGQDIWDFPRLYVDGSSWVWKYAISAVQRVGAPEEEQ
jgi:hypothetical protein